MGEHIKIKLDLACCLCHRPCRQKGQLQTDFEKLLKAISQLKVTSNPLKEVYINIVGCNCQQPVEIDFGD